MRDSVFVRELLIAADGLAKAGRALEVASEALRREAGCASKSSIRRSDPEAPTKEGGEGSDPSLPF